MFTTAAIQEVLSLHEQPAFGQLECALDRVIRRGDVVVELDAGLGLHTQRIARASGAKVFAVETTELAAHLETAVGASELRGQVQVVRSLQDLNPDRVDVVVTKIFPSALLAPSLWREWLPLRDRAWFRDVRRVLPARVALRAVLVEAPEPYARACPWHEYSYGLEVEALNEMSRRRPVAVTVRSSEIVSSAVPVGTYRIARSLELPRYDQECRFEVLRDATCHGVMLLGQGELAPDDWHGVEAQEGGQRGLFLPFASPVRAARLREVVTHLSLDGLELRFGARLDSEPEPCPSPAAVEAASPRAWKARGYRQQLTRSLLQLARSGVSTRQVLPELTERLGASSLSERRLLKRNVEWVLSKGLTELE
ncbi:MAG: class I SAM-dependent methyltransferase [bacterium]|nr:class I SAM-dependent methyltransferase [bacterium]